MSCQIEQIADCGDIASINRALFIQNKDVHWLSQSAISISSCGGLLAIGHKNRLCLLTAQWISSTDSSSFLVSFSTTLPSNISAVLVLPICPMQQSSQNGPDWFCIIVGFSNGSVGFYTNTGHLLFLEKLDEKPVIKISCHTGTYGTLPDDIHILFPNCECIITGSTLFQTMRLAKSQLARVQAGIQEEYTVDTRSINIRKWMFSEQETVHDAAVVGIELKNSYDHLLAASTYGGYDTWYRSVPPVNTLILGTGVQPYVGFHYALEGGTTPPLQDVARAVANKIKSALPGWLGGGSMDAGAASPEPRVKAEAVSMRCGLYDALRCGSGVAVSPDRRLAAFADNLGRVAVFDVHRGHLIRMFKGYRDAQCGFVQVFEPDNKRPHLSTIKEVRRAIFLIIYNPKKGLIDIRLMQRGQRVAVFTATKHGKLIYNTCGLVGTEKSYTHKKLNLPEYQCLLLDPDGKLKKLNIPFFYALEGANSDKSKDLHVLRELRDYIKRTSVSAEDYEEEIIKKVTELKTLDLKKHSLEMLIRNYEIPPKIIMRCLETFWESIDKEELTANDQKILQYFANLTLITSFYRRINNESTEDMQLLLSKVDDFYGLDHNEDESYFESKLKDENPEFTLLEDDNCILERLLILAQENNYKDNHARVKFADNKLSNYKEFVSCFQLECISNFLSLKPDLSSDKLNNLANDVFTSIFSMSEPQILTRLIQKSKIDPKVIIELLIMHLMKKSLEDISIELIEKLIMILYYICNVTEEANIVVYDELSPWWQKIRDLLVDMPCPLRSMIVAMVCKAVSRIFEIKSIDTEVAEAWESVSKENAKWGILIGKLEDISILSIVLMSKDTFKGKSLPKLRFDNFNINLKYIYTRGKGSVTELIGKWLCGMGVLPEAIIANELIEIEQNTTSESPEETETYPIVENYRIYVEENPKLFKLLSLLRRQFPLSSLANYIIANMCWEYAIAWQKNMQKCEELQAVIQCIKNISDLHVRFGLFSIIWSTYIKQIFEASCRLINKVGKTPKDPLCLQDLGFNNKTMLEFMKYSSEYLNCFILCFDNVKTQEKQPIQYEKIWEESSPSLVEVAQNTKNVNDRILSLNYQVCCTVYYQCHFNVKFPKPLDNLYDIDYQFILEALAGNITIGELSVGASEKLKNPRLKFLTKLIRAAIETISVLDSEGPFRQYDTQEFLQWIEKISILSDLWNVSDDIFKRQQVIGLYHLGYDSIAESILSTLADPEDVLLPLLAITIQRFKRSLEQCDNQPEWIVSLPPQLYKRLQETMLDPSIPANPSLNTTASLLQKVIYEIEKKYKGPPKIPENIKYAQLMIESCQVLLRRKLSM